MKDYKGISNKKIMVAGHLCLDITPNFSEKKHYNFDHVFSPGRLTNVEKPTFSPGGPVANTGLAMAKLGADVKLNAKIGNDTVGSLIEQVVGKEQSLNFKKVTGINTSYTMVMALPGFDRFFLHNPGSNDTFVSEDIDYDTAAFCDIFHFGYPPLMKEMYENNGKELVKIFKRVKQHGITTSLDMAMPDPASKSGQVDWKIILNGVLPYVDIFLPSIDEIVFMLNRDLFEEKQTQAGDKDSVSLYTPEDCARFSSQLLSMGSKIIVLKCGYRGIYLRTGTIDSLKSIPSGALPGRRNWYSRELWAESYRADNFKSALGAGDATIAGFLCGLVAGYSPSETLKLANTVGWQNVQAYDTLSGIRTWKDTVALMRKKSRKRNSAGINSPDWQFSDELEVYCGPNNLETIK